MITDWFLWLFRSWNWSWLLIRPHFLPADLSNTRFVHSFLAYSLFGILILVSGFDQLLDQILLADGFHNHGLWNSSISHELTAQTDEPPLWRISAIPFFFFDALTFLRYPSTYTSLFSCNSRHSVAIPVIQLQCPSVNAVTVWKKFLMVSQSAEALFIVIQNSLAFIVHAFPRSVIATAIQQVIVFEVKVLIIGIVKTLNLH